VPRGRLGVIHRTQIPPVPNSAIAHSDSGITYLLYLRLYLYPVRWKCTPSTLHARARVAVSRHVDAAQPRVD